MACGPRFSVPASGKNYADMYCYQSEIGVIYHCWGALP